MSIHGAIPNLQYRDPKAAIKWLETAFGFETRLVVPHGEGDDEIIVHAQITCGKAMVMISTAGVGMGNDSGDGKKIMTHPDETGGASTMGIFLVVDDPDAHFARAQKAGADIVKPLTEQPYGGKDYAARDCEGHLWSFGTYDPWAG
ncbi:MAG: VOC family protein [Parvularculaceae bacterium]